MFRRKNKNEFQGRRSPSRQNRAGTYVYFSSSNRENIGQSQTPSARQRLTGAPAKPARQPSNPKAGRHVLAIFAAIVICIILIYESTLTDNPKIEIQKSGTANSASQLQPTSVYEQYAQKLFDKNISNKDKITVDTAAIASSLQRHFPEISTVSITLPLFGHQPVIYIEPANLALILKDPNGQLHALNGSGVDLADVSNQNYDDLPVITDEAGLQVSVGGSALPQPYVVFIEVLNDQLNSNHIKVSSMKLLADGELDVYPSGEHYFVKFNLNDNTHDKQQIGDFLAVSAYLNQHNITPSQYIDARIAGRAYYK